MKKEEKKSNFHLAPLLEGIGLKRVKVKEWEFVDGTEEHVDKKTGERIIKPCKVAVPKR